MERNIAKCLLEIGAVSLRTDPPFTWTSGRLAPIYCDNRLLMSYPEKRNQVTRGFDELIASKDWAPDVIAGTATAGIPHAAWLAQRLDLPMVYVRGSAKQHGKENRIEGKLDRGQKVVLIEDLISTGGSSLEAALGLLSAGADVIGVLSIFTYGLRIAQKRFEEARVPVSSLTSFEVLMDAALSQGVLRSEEKSILLDWQKDPAGWSEERQGKV
jgi:orotate phosphoribosyltransferase